ncbi:MAG: PPC domain-containing protein [Fibromonadales bacterium]|nr:PPC domain-containing protein [Fibromonadales bacterium]
MRPAWLTLLPIALCLTTAMAQTSISLTELLDNPAKVKTITYGTNLLSIPFTQAGQLADLVAGDTEEHFRVTGESYWAAAYKITLSKGNRIRIKSSKIDGDSHLDVYLKNGDKYEFVDHNVSISATDLDSYLSLIIQKDGDYYIVIADNEPDIQGFHTLTVWIPADPLYSNIHYTPLAIDALPALGTAFNLVEIRGRDFPGAGYSFTAEKGKTYSVNVHYFAREKHDMYYSITLFDKLTGFFNEDKVTDNSKWDYSVFELTQTLLYTAENDGIMYVLLDNYDPHNIEKFYEDVLCAIEIKEVKKKEVVSLNQLLNNTTKTIVYNQALEFVDGGKMIDLMEGNYYAATYKITLGAGNKIEILSSKGGDFYSDKLLGDFLDSYLYIYRKNGNEYERVAQNDDGYKTSNNLDSYLNFTATQSGDYYIVVTDAKPNFAGSYYLKVWNTPNMPSGIITSIFANARDITIDTEEEILATLVMLELNGTIGNGTIAIVNNPHGWTISGNKHYATYKPNSAPGPYGFVYANELEPITINLSILSSPAIAKAPQPTSFKAWAQNGTLQLNGLTTGKIWSVYTVSGTLVQQGIANGTNAAVHLNANGVYFVRSEGKTARVVNR